jgi:hypothetical protein
VTSREIDALVAEKVMELTVQVFYETPAGYSPHELSSVPKETGFGQSYRRVQMVEYGGKKHRLPRYSASWAAAGQVVEELHSGRVHKGAAAVIELCISDACYMDGFCSCKVYAPDLAEIEAFANSVPMAVCLAALKIRGIEVTP